MKKIYESIDFTMVGYYQSILEAEGIATEIRNYYTSSLTGVVATGKCNPELWIVDDSDYDKAADILRPHLNQKTADDINASS
jgi:hypothetical protein